MEYQIMVSMTVGRSVDCCVHTGSAMSLVAGVLFGGLAAAGTFQMSNDPQNFYLLLGQYSSLKAS